MAFNVSASFTGKNVFITGSNGFLGKVLVEKLLRAEEGVGRIYLLIRPANGESAILRMDKVLETDLFKPLKRIHGADFESFVSRKIAVVEGDLGMNNELGIESHIVKEELYNNIHIIINNAATTSFDDRYDVSLSVNTLGAKNVVEFAKRCKHVESLVHVSTAYVIGRGNGIAMETPLEEGVRVGSNNDFKSEDPIIHNIHEEIQWFNKTMNKLVKMEENEDRRTVCLKALGLERAKKYGWPNTYSFTKAMGEMLVNKHREDLPVVIVRPSIIQSTLSDPFPGWIEGNRTVDVVINGYGKGLLTGFLGHPDMNLDVIPADMVVNAIIVGAAENANKGGSLKVYHMATSLINPLSYRVLKDVMKLFFTHNSYVDKQGSNVMVKDLTLFDTMSAFRFHLFMRYGLFLKAIEWLSKLLFQISETKVKSMRRRYDFMVYLAELYEPYALFYGSFDVSNVERLNDKLNVTEKKMYAMELKSIEWVKYYYDVHIPGLVKRVFK